MVQASHENMKTNLPWIGRFLGRALPLLADACYSHAVRRHYDDEEALREMFNEWADDARSMSNVDSEDHRTTGYLVSLLDSIVLRADRETANLTQVDFAKRWPLADRRELEQFIVPDVSDVVKRST